MTKMYWDEGLTDEDRKPRGNQNVTHALRGLDPEYRAVIGPYSDEDGAMSYGYKFWYNVKAQGGTHVTGPAKTIEAAHYLVLAQMLNWGMITPDQAPETDYPHAKEESNE